jgi:hypothetical protein
VVRRVLSANQFSSLHKGETHILPILSVVGFAFLAGLMLITRGLATESLGYLTP